MNSSSPSVDVAVIGSGIVGLSHAWTAVRRGLRVALFERDAIPNGASVRNFGMVWPIGQPDGQVRSMAMASRERWCEFGREAEFDVRECGSLHLAHRPDELRVLEEFTAHAKTMGYDCALLTPLEVRRLCPAVSKDRLLGGLWSPTELGVDPLAALQHMRDWLGQAFGVHVLSNTTVKHVDTGRVLTTSGDEWRAERIVVASGQDTATLFPQEHHAMGLIPCKLQMMATVPQPSPRRLSTHVAGGLTLRHYANFKVCASLESLRVRIANEAPELDRYGIHVLAAQQNSGEVVLGDSHEYGDGLDPFYHDPIEGLIHREVQKLVQLEYRKIQRRWFGIYLKHPEHAYVVASPRPGVSLINGLGGSGMTLAFGLADFLWEQGSL